MRRLSESEFFFWGGVKLPSALVRICNTGHPAGARCAAEHGLWPSLYTVPSADLSGLRALYKYR
jgi:hypothetical protein